MKKIRIAVPFALASLMLLTGCSGVTTHFGNDSNGADDKRTEISLKWYSTDRGDVYCTDLTLPYAMEQHDCDWETLGKRPETEKVDTPLPSQWVRTEKGEVWCLVNRTSHSGNTTDCDWSTLGKRVNSERLPVM